MSLEPGANGKRTGSAALTKSAGKNAHLPLLQGLDLDWEYPRCWQVDCSLGPDSDKAAFSDLVRELSQEFKPRGNTGGDLCELRIKLN